MMVIEFLRVWRLIPSILHKSTGSKVLSTISQMTLESRKVTSFGISIKEELSMVNLLLELPHSEWRIRVDQPVLGLELIEVAEQQPPKL